MTSFSNVAVVGIAGTEDEARQVASGVLKALKDVSWSTLAGADYWVGEAMQKDFRDLPAVPDAVAGRAAMLAANAVNLATMLRDEPFPGIPEAK
jgi:hypothetical protein